MEAIDAATHKWIAYLQIFGANKSYSTANTLMYLYEFDISYDMIYGLKSKLVIMWNM